MTSYDEIAREFDIDVEQVRAAMQCAERVTDRKRLGAQPRICWFVAMGAAGAYGYDGDRFAHADGYGRTRENAVRDALRREGRR